jgi:hypothetical protein
MMPTYGHQPEANRVGERPDRDPSFAQACADMR